MTIQCDKKVKLLPFLSLVAGFFSYATIRVVFSLFTSPCTYCMFKCTVLWLGRKTWEEKQFRHVVWDKRSENKPFLGSLCHIVFVMDQKLVPSRLKIEQIEVKKAVYSCDLRRIWIICLNCGYEKVNLVNVGSIILISFRKYFAQLHLENLYIFVSNCEIKTIIVLFHCIQHLLCFFSVQKKILRFKMILFWWKTHALEREREGERQKKISEFYCVLQSFDH